MEDKSFSQEPWSLVKQRGVFASGNLLKKQDIRVGWIKVLGVFCPGKALRPNPPKNAHMLIPSNKGGFASLNPPYTNLILNVVSHNIRTL